MRARFTAPPKEEKMTLNAATTEALTVEIFNACADLPSTLGCRTMCLWEILVNMSVQNVDERGTLGTRRECMAAIASQMTGALSLELSSDVRAWIGIPVRSIY